MRQPFINLIDYTATELIIFGIGCFLWVVTYFFTIHNIIKKQFIEIPLVAVCGNIAWEFLWSWIFVINMGSLFQWGYRIWFFMDCFIVYSLFRYGYKQIDIPELKKRSKQIILFGIGCWLFILYFYIKNYDEPISKTGAYSGYILNIVISGLYLPQFLRMQDKSLYSLPVAWAKGIGTGLISVFCFMHYSDWFLLSMCIITAVLDAIYIYLYMSYTKRVTNTSILYNEQVQLT